MSTWTALHVYGKTLYTKKPHPYHFKLYPECCVMPSMMFAAFSRMMRKTLMFLIQVLSQIVQ